MAWGGGSGRKGNIYKERWKLKDEGVNEKSKVKFSIIQYSLRLQMYLALVCSDIFRLSNLKCYKACGLHSLTSDTELNKKHRGKKELQWHTRTCIGEQFLL
jgi:hypothetical protein